MSQKLKSRQKQIPNGFRYRESAISWDSTKVLGLHPSFDTLVRAVQNARKANPSHAAKHKWALDTAGVANDVEAYQVRICQQMGYTSYLTDPGGGGGAPFSQSLLNPKQLQSAVAGVKKIWQGVKTLNDFLDSNEPPVASELAEARATTCESCSSNGKGDWSQWFTKPASMAIARQLERLQERKISTSKDSELQTCEVCLCPLRLKVVTPLKFIKSHMTPDVLNDLRAANPNCWIPKELESSEAVG